MQRRIKPAVREYITDDAVGSQLCWQGSSICCWGWGLSDERSQLSALFLSCLCWRDPPPPRTDLLPGAANAPTLINRGVWWLASLAPTPNNYEGPLQFRNLLCGQLRPRSNYIMIFPSLPFSSLPFLSCPAVSTLLSLLKVFIWRVLNNKLFAC